jgi:hypothetical protein
MRHAETTAGCPCPQHPFGCSRHPYGCGCQSVVHFPPMGCICPPTSEQTCQNGMCPRKPIAAGIATPPTTPKP